MLSRLYEQRQAISTYAVDNEISTLTSTQWSLVGNIVYVLKPFEEVTKLASADKEYKYKLRDTSSNNFNDISIEEKSRIE